MTASNLTEQQQSRIREAFRPLEMQGALRPVARRFRRATPEYEQAKAEGRSKEWLDREGDSLVYALRQTIENRLEDLDA